MNVNDKNLYWKYILKMITRRNENCSHDIFVLFVHAACVSFKQSQFVHAVCKFS